MGKLDEPGEVANSVSPAETNTSEIELSPTQPMNTSATPAVWRPAIGATWQWQLTGLPVDLSVDAQVVDIDLFESDASVVAACMPWVASDLLPERRHVGGLAAG